MTRSSLWHLALYKVQRSASPWRRRFDVPDTISPPLASLGGLDARQYGRLRTKRPCGVVFDSLSTVAVWRGGRATMKHANDGRPCLIANAIAVYNQSWPDWFQDTPNGP